MNLAIKYSLVCLGTIAFNIAVSWYANAADASTCYTIASADHRAYCLAKAHRDPGRCYSVQDAGLRAQCLAEVRR